MKKFGTDIPCKLSSSSSSLLISFFCSLHHNYLFYSSYSSYPLKYVFFFERDIKTEVCMWE